MRTKSLLLAGLVGIAMNVSAKPHLHGSGTLFIAQDDSLWQLQFVLPASDVVGFEHKPENERQAKKALTQSDILRTPSNVFVVPNSCQVESAELTVPFELEMTSSGEHKHGHEDEHDHDEHKHDHEDGHDHDEHQHAHKDEHNHDKHNHDEHKHAHEEETHLDFDATYVLNCDAEMNHIDITLFEHYPSLNELTVMKVTEQGQGNSLVSVERPRVELQ